MMKAGKNGIKRLISAVAALIMMLELVFCAPMTESRVEAAVLNPRFTTMAEMQGKLGTADNTWNAAYLTQIELYYWSFADDAHLGTNELTIDIVKNVYRNLEQLLDNGYVMDYHILAAYTAQYLATRAASGLGVDEFYNTLNMALDNPYLLNKPVATVTATTYNGRDYSKVFDATYYAAHNPDVAAVLGNNPAELLRHFVENGMNEGRRGNEAFDVTAYAAQLDAQVLAEMKASSIYQSLGGAAQPPVGKYSYSLANYYSKYLGFYDGAITSVTNGNKVLTGVYTETNPLSVYTGLPVDPVLANQRPIAVMMPTDKTAQPSYGISRAEVLYEIMEEGNISRQMAIIQNWKDMPKIGNIRSCRLYYLYAAKEWDPILIHFGGVFNMHGVVDGEDMNNLSGTYEYGTGGAAPGAGKFYRTSDRKAPHNAYISAEGIISASKSLGYQLGLRNGYYNPRHFLFTAGINDLSQYPEAKTANVIDLSQVFSYTKSALTYNAAEGVYYKTLHGVPQKDGMNGQQLTFTNVIVQNTKWTYLSTTGSYLYFQMLDNTEDGYYFTKGKCIHVHWTKNSDYEVTRYFDDYGNEIQLNPGKTYIAIAQKGKNVLFQ